MPHYSTTGGPDDSTKGVPLDSTTLEHAKAGRHLITGAAPPRLTNWKNYTNVVGDNQMNTEHLNYGLTGLGRKASKVCMIRWRN